MTVKERLHHAVEAMTDEEARAALRTLADTSGDPVAEARADRERGIEPVSLDAVLAEFDAQ